MKKKAILMVCLLVFSFSLFSYSSKLEEKLFYGLGHFGATFLYQSYMNIGMVSDIWTKNIYSPDDAKSILNANLSFLETSQNLLKELTDFAIDNEDRGTFLEMIAIIDNLKNEAEYLLKYMGNRNQDDLNEYEKFRTQSWAQISKLMDIK